MTSSRLPNAYSAQELAALYRVSIPRPEVAAVMRLLQETGLRSAEALSISADEARTWNQPLGRWPRKRVGVVFCRIVGKGDKERLVAVSPEAQRAAQRLLAHPSRNGRAAYLVPWSDRGLRLVIHEAGELAGVHAHPHRFRHTAIQTWVDAGVPVQTVADMAGHSSIDITRLYFAASSTARVDALEATARFRRG